MAGPRGRAVLAVAGLLAVLAPTVRAQTEVCGIPRRVVERDDGWTEMRELPFEGLGTGQVTAYAASPTDPRHAYATNGFVVLRTDDGGCLWHEVWRSDRLAVGQLPALARVPRVVDLAIPPLRPSDLVLLVADTAAGVTSPTVLVSSDRGATYAQSLVGLPPGGEPQLLALGMQAGHAYATVRVDDVLDGSRVDVYRSTDDGRTWARQGGLPGGTAPADLRVDPRLGTRLWAVAGGTLYRSDDAGATFAGVTAVSEPVGSVAVAPTNAGTRVVAAHAERPFVYVSDDGGDTWHARYALHVGRSVAAAAKRPLVAAAGPLGVAVLSSVATDVSAGVDVGDLSFSEPPSRSPVLFGRNSRGLLRYEVDRSTEERRPRRPSVPVDIDEVPDLAAEPASLAPGSATLRLGVGETRKLDYVLDLPPTPTPLDVMFLVDTTGSMQPVIDGLRGGIGRIVKDLAALGVDARFGVAEFKDYPGEGYGNAGDVPYRLLRAVGRADAELEHAIELLEASGGGDAPESALTALYQSVTGAGDAYDGEMVVPRGADAGFRPGSLRVAVIATDTTFHDEAGYPGPGFATVVRVLREAQVHVVGLAANGGGRDDLARVAAASRTYAPADGVDCDGDEQADVAEGEPLVCDVGGLPFGGPGNGEPGVDLAPAVGALLRALRDEATVGLVGTGAPVVRVLAPAAYARTNVKAANTLAFRVEVGCPAELRGRTVRAGLGAVRRAETVARAGLTVACLAAPARPAPAFVPVPPQARPPAAAAAVPPPPPPPAPVQNPQPQPQPHPNPQPQPNPQTGFAAQEQEQPQVAVADSGVEADGELAMSGLATEQPRGPEATLLAAAVLACAAAGAVGAARRPAAATVRRR